MKQELLPDYQLRISQRAKYPHLRIKQDGTLEVVLPVGCDKSLAQSMVREKISWISKHQKNIQTKRTTKLEEVYPENIHFPALNQSIAVKYSNNGRNVWQDDGNLTIFTTEKSYIRPVLQHWLKQHTQAYLSAMLAEIAIEMNESYRSVSIRLQKTRWGSCSNQRRINLNAKLLLLPKVLMRYVLVHELAHLKHLNHSALFWQHVSEFEPDYHLRRQELRDWEHTCPYWVSLQE